MKRHPPVFPLMLILAGLAVTGFSFGLGAFLSHASMTLNGTGVTASASNGNFLDLTSNFSTLFAVNSSGNVGANEFYGSTVSATPSPNLSFTSGGGLNLSAGGTNQNITLSPSGTGATIASNLEDKGGQVFNVKAYGAKIDGSTDDAAAFQSAINAASAAGGGMVYVPPGTAVLDSALNMAANVDVVCASRASILSFVGATNGFVWPNTASYSGLYKCTLQAANPSSGKAIDIEGPSNAASDITVEDVTITAVAPPQTFGRTAYF